MKQRSLSAVIYILTTVIGVLAFLYPFWLPAFSRMANMGMAHAGDAPLMLSLLVGLCFVVLLLEVQSQAMNAKTLALLGILVSINAVLRFAEVAIPGPGGFSPIFLLIVLTGYVYGARFGFLMGVLTLLVSSLITGTVGPWLPYQMFAAGWSGMAAPLCRPVVRLLRAEQSWGEVIVLAVYSGLWGLIYGAIMNIWFWPFMVGPAAQFWEPGVGLVDTLQRYALFYLVTSFAWDIIRLVGNAGLTLAFGMPVLRILRRFHQRFDFSYTPAGGSHDGLEALPGIAVGQWPAPPHKGPEQTPVGGQL